MNTGNQEVFGAIMGTLQRTGNHCMGYIPENMLFADEEFQRIETRDAKKIRNLVNTWDPNRMDPLTVVPHPETGMFSVVDGLGRMTAARMKGLTHLECHVITNAPKDPKERKLYEAKIFLHQLDNIEQLKPTQMHNARILLGDKNAIILDKVTKEFNCEIMPDKGYRSTGQLGSYTRAYNIVKTQGEGGLRFIFRTCKKAGYDLESNGYSSYNFRALANMYKAYGDRAENVVAELMRPMKPDRLKARAIAKYPERGTDVALTLFLQDEVVRVMKVARRFDEKGKLIA